MIQHTWEGNILSALLFTKKRFFPYFCCQFLGAFNDNLYKNVLVITIVYQIAHAHSGLLINIAAIAFILPFLLFGALAGQVADKFEKAALIQKIKLAEIVIMLLACVALAYQNIYFMLVVLFLLGTQSAFFGPIKYAILPQHLASHEIVTGNGYVEAGTFLAILIGTLLGGVLAEKIEYTGILMGILVSLACLGWLVSTQIPRTHIADTQLSIDFNIVKSSVDLVRSAKKHPSIFLAILAISWFWFFGSVLLTQFPIFTKTIVFANERVVNLLLAVFSIGVAVGSVICAKLSRGKAEIGFVPIGAFGMSFFIWLLSYTSFIPDAQLRGVEALFAMEGSVMMVFSLFMISLFAGMYIVPLYTFIQIQCDEKQLSRIFAVNNIINSMFMVAAGILCALMLSVGFSVVHIFKVVAILNLVVAFYIVAKMPAFFLRLVSWVLVHCIYRFKKDNLHHIPQTGAALLVCNHVSYFDSLLILAAGPRPIRFVMHHSFYKAPIAHYVFKWLRCIPVVTKKEDPNILQHAYEQIADALEKGELVCIFPEGSITRDGIMQKFQPGVEKILRRTPVPVVPMALCGMWGTWSSFADGKAVKKIPISFMKKLSLVAAEPIPAKLATKEKLFDEVAALRGSNQ